MEWNRLRVFYYVAKAQGIKRAASELHIAQPSITRTIQQLEYQAKAKLFVRHPRGMTLTKQGEILFHYVKNMMSDLEQAKNEILGVADKTSGQLTITTTYAYASAVLFPYICRFLKLYPEVNITLNCNDQDLDLTKKEADVAIRPYDPYATELEQLYLHERRLQLFASQAYLNEKGIPEKSEDLDHHQLIIFDVPSTQVHTDQRNNWLLTLGMNSGHLRKPFLVVNSAECLAQAAAEGLGIIGLSHDSTLIKKYNLIRVFPNFEATSSKMCYVYPTALKNIKLVKMLGIFLQENFKEKID